ncbi:hypothetical protein BGX24_002067 [Mortierella sp. AD032]|nr:hypothetical protein BGX24_002067 [Mortierella sp. AD032]
MTNHSSKKRKTLVHPLNEQPKLLLESLLQDYSQSDPSQVPPAPSSVATVFDLLVRSKGFGCFVTIIESFFTSTAHQLGWSPSGHTTEYGTNYMTPEYSDFGQHKNISVVSERVFDNLASTNPLYRAFFERLGLLYERDTRINPTASTAAAATATTAIPFEDLFDTPVLTPRNAFPLTAKRIIVAKAIFKDTDKGHKEIDFYYVLEFALLVCPDQPASLSSSSSSSNSEKPPLSWKATNNRYRLNVSSDNQEYFEALVCPGRSKPCHALKIKLGLDDNSTQSFFAMRKPDISHADLSVFSGNSVREPDTFVEPKPSEFLMTSVEQPDNFSLQGLDVNTGELPKRRKLRFKKAEYYRHYTQKSLFSPRVEPVPPSTKLVFCRITAAKDPPASSVLNAIVFHQSQWARASSSGSPSSDGSPGRKPSPCRSLSPSSSEDDDDSEGENDDDNDDGSPGPSLPPKRRIACPHVDCRSSIHSDKAMKQHLKDAHQAKSEYKSCGHLGCKATFPRMNDLKRHEKTHDQRNHAKCGACGQSFTRKYIMEKHQKACGVADCKGKNKKK